METRLLEIARSLNYYDSMTCLNFTAVCIATNFVELYVPTFVTVPIFPFFKFLIHLYMAIIIAIDS